MKTRYLRYLIIVIALVLGMLALATPRVKTDQSEFSAENAMKDIEEIAKVPHTVEDYDALEAVRLYLFDRMDELELNPYITTYSVTDPDYQITEVNNLIGVIPGESDSYILLVAHYDSSPAKRSGETAGSKGAADDGYGLSSILETIRVIKENDIEMKNGIKILFTDAEEIGLYGAEKEVEENPQFFEDVAFVINVEARGVKGPSIMFQTSLQNYKVMKFYQKASFPVSFSLAGDVYNNMPNSTDFTPMLEEGLTGINMSVLDNLDYYHTPLDNIDNVSLTSLQHYGEVIYPLVKEFVSNPQYSDVNYFESDDNATYFTLLPKVFIVYSTTTQNVLVITTVLLFFTILYLAYKAKEITISRHLKCTLVWLGLMILLLIDGLLISYILSLVTGVDFNLTYMPKIPFNLGIFLLFIILDTIIIGYFIKWFVSIKHNENTLYFGGLTLHVIFMLLFSVLLPGGTYLFMIPLLVSCIIYIEKYLLMKRKIGNQKIYNIMESFNIIIPVLLFAPILYLLYLALTIGALGIVLLFLTFPLAIVFPTIERLEKSHS